MYLISSNNPNDEQNGTLLDRNKNGEIEFGIDEIIVSGEKVRDASKFNTHAKDLQPGISRFRETLPKILMKHRNEIQGIEPKIGKVPLLCDSKSDIDALPGSVRRSGDFAVADFYNDGKIDLISFKLGQSYPAIIAAHRGPVDCTLDPTRGSVEQFLKIFDTKDEAI